MNQYILRSVRIDLGIHSLSNTLSGNSEILVYRSVRGGDTAGFRKYEVNEKNIKHALKMQAMILHRIAPAPLPVAEPVTFAGVDDKFEVAGWDEPTAEEVARFWNDENADERADVIREARYGKQL